jgi:hypothetical protein
MSPAGQTWDDRWRALSPRARSALIRQIKAPASAHSTRPPFLEVTRLADDIVAQLTTSGLVERRLSPTGRPPERLVVPPAAVAYVHWVQGLAQWHLLAADGVHRLPGYVSSSFYGPNLDTDLRPVLREAGASDTFVSRATLMDQYVTSGEWPALVARALHQPLAEAVLRVIDEAGGVILKDELFGRFDVRDWEKVREMLTALVRRLALFHDLRQGTL